MADFKSGKRKENIIVGISLFCIIVTVILSVIYMNQSYTSLSNQLEFKNEENIELQQELNRLGIENDDLKHRLSGAYKQLERTEMELEKLERKSN